MWIKPGLMWQKCKGLLRVIVSHHVCGSCIVFKFPLIYCEGLVLHVYSCVVLSCFRWSLYYKFSRARWSLFVLACLFDPNDGLMAINSTPPATFVESVVESVEPPPARIYCCCTPRTLSLIAWFSGYGRHYYILTGFFFLTSSEECPYSMSYCRHATNPTCTCLWWCTRHIYTSYICDGFLDIEACMRWRAGVCHRKRQRIHAPGCWVASASSREQAICEF